MNWNKERKFNIAVSEVPFQLFLVFVTATRSRETWIFGAEDMNLSQLA